jgi:hypothetical protein
MPRLKPSPAVRGSRGATETRFCEAQQSIEAASTLH